MGQSNPWLSFLTKKTCGWRESTPCAREILGLGSGRGALDASFFACYSEVGAMSSWGLGGGGRE
jgi:hypothetical protein